MNEFDDMQIEEISGFDFAEECFDEFFDETVDDSQSFNSFLNSNIDY